MITVLISTEAMARSRKKALSMAKYSSGTTTLATTTEFSTASRSPVAQVVDTVKLLEKIVLHLHRDMKTLLISQRTRKSSMLLAWDQSNFSALSSSCRIPMPFRPAITTLRFQFGFTVILVNHSIGLTAAHLGTMPIDTRFSMESRSFEESGSWTRMVLQHTTPKLW